MNKKEQKSNEVVTAPRDTTSNDASSKINAIKDLIFGENIQEYNHEFENIKADILKKKKELEAFVEDTKTELLKSIDNLSTDVNIRITELEDKTVENIENLEDKKVDRQVLGDLLIKLGEKINQ